MRRLIALLLLALPVLAQTPEDVARRVDAVFANDAKPDSPGCAVGVARGGKSVLERAYGMANLEYDVPLTAGTILEAGSVSKQFTAAAVLHLAQDGKLSLDDPVRKYIPELPEVDAGITIRHILTHTSGLRDWGTVVGLAGWPRGTRTVNHALVLDVIVHQRALNFAPGTQWSYSNSGYNLAAMLVERVSGKSFSDFTRERLFTPLGMTHSSWRDDFARVVKGRATAYDPDKSGYVTDMSPENIYGNCCLLTTVGDLLRWSENFRGPIRDAMQTPAKLTGGLTTDYGFGLFIGDDGEVYHSGATAGWRAFLTRRPKDDLTIAVLCNRGDAGTGTLAEKVAQAFGATAPLPAARGESARKPGEGLYRDPTTDAVFRIANNHLGLRAGSGPELTPIAENRFHVARNVELRVDDAGLHLKTAHKPEALYVKVAEATPTASQLNDYAGAYVSDEAGATYVVSARAGKLSVTVLPGQSFDLEPTYADGFMSSGALVRFTRDANGRIDGADVKADFSPVEGSARVERMHFVRR